MCFRNLAQTKAKIAEEDIECYKFLEERQSGLISPFYGDFHWLEKEVITAINFKKEVEEVLMDLNHGFHSSKTLNNCIRYRENEEHSTSCAIYKFIIPKGTLYFENHTQYLSEKIYLASKEAVEDKVVYDEEPVEF